MVQSSAADTAPPAKTPGSARTPGIGRMPGIGRVLIVVYGILALAATGRSVVQILTKFDQAPVAYLLSAVSAVVYIVATVALIARGRRWYSVAWATIAFEFVGVVVIGLLSVFDPVLFPQDTVWSYFGRGYVFIPLVLPILGMLLLYSRRPSKVALGAAGSRSADVVEADPAANG